jgi:hypothetical protein
MKRTAAAAAMLALALSACGEIDQSKTSATVDRGDQPSYQSAATPNMAKGFAPGSKDAWNKQVRERGQLQNEYNRISAR